MPNAFNAVHKRSNIRRDGEDGREASRLKDAWTGTAPLIGLAFTSLHPKAFLKHKDDIMLSKLTFSCVITSGGTKACSSGNSLSTTSKYRGT